MDGGGVANLDADMLGVGEARARARSEELRTGLPVEPEELRGVVRAPREETIPETRIGELTVLLRDLVGTGRVVPPAPTTIFEEVDSSHPGDSRVSPKETSYARGVEREV